MWGPSESDVYRRQTVTYKVGPRAVRAKQKRGRGTMSRQSCMRPGFEPRCSRVVFKETALFLPSQCD